MKNKNAIPARTLERLTLYRRLLRDLLPKGQEHIHSHELAEMAHNNSAQVRRDLMISGYAGTPRKGYAVKKLIERINILLDDCNEQKIALVGIGNLGRAILSYFSHKQPTLSIVAAFDSDDTKVNRVISGCRSFHIRDFEAKVKEEGISLGIITVPADRAQDVANMMVGAGIKGILNFAPLPLKVPDGIYLDVIDITMTLEKIAFFAKNNITKPVSE